MDEGNTETVMHLVSLPQEISKCIGPTTVTTMCAESATEERLETSHESQLTQDPHELEVEIIPPTPTESDKPVEAKEINVTDAEYPAETFLPRVNCTEKIVSQTQIR